ncbi:DUF1573 domain-containing protein [Arenibacter sp. GZD96]|uniref:DUF1573 domain-containing protein n=1 Tax=Aurantibrevibacter litoralis TaxID=3106030 RepID=UPI002AFE3380|nr:DUF1573 domain-containing protein [Arenibacter sp. GZD-96]MEA1787054.1 DUF1573 domain-containing protein [Arenibacter sp. GZD-96]
MKNVLTSLVCVSLMAFVSCKEKASDKINATNVEVASERDQASKSLPVMTFEKSEHDFGVIEQNAAQETVFKFTNTGNAPLIITNATSSCGCTVPDPPKDPILPGDSGELLVKFNGAGQNQVTKTITVTANTEKGSEILRIKAFVNPKGATSGSPL